MKYILVLNLLFVSLFSIAQEDEFKVPRLRKVAIGSSGCFAYMPSDDIEFTQEYSPDSSIVYTGEVTEGEFNYAIIVVKLGGTVLENNEEKTSMLESYLDYLKEQFSITEFTGYGEGHELESNPDAIGVIDYWIDEEMDTWQVKGWADSKTIAVLMIYGPKEYPNFNVQQMYLEGIRFE